MSKNGEVRVAIIGVGNCASSLVQGVEFYKDAADDAVRGAKLSLDRGISDPLIEPFSYFMKTPLTQFTDDIARQKTEDFIADKK